MKYKRQLNRLEDNIYIRLYHNFFRRSFVMISNLFFDKNLSIEFGWFYNLTVLKNIIRLLLD